MRGYFAHIDHLVLKAQLTRRFRSHQLLALLARIIDTHSDTPGRGLPIGALTSQTFANAYLGPCDRFLLETCQVAGLVRYMDDIVFWGPSRGWVADVVRQARAFVAESLRLEIKETVQINRSALGVPVCGYRVFPGTIRLAPSRKRRYWEAVRRWEARYRAGLVSDAEYQRALGAVLGIVAHADSAGWRRCERSRARPLAGEGA